MFENYPDVVTISELCSMLRIGKNTAYDLIHSQRIESIYVKRQIRIPKTGVIAFMKSNNTGEQ